MRRLLFIIAILAAFGLGLLLRNGGKTRPDDQPLGPSDQTEASATIWTCSMHPQIKLPHPGPCPICGMDLIPLVDDSRNDLGPRSLQMSPGATALAEIRTTSVVRSSAEMDLDLLGRLVVDETLDRTIASWVPGRIDTLFVDFTGARVKAGDPLASIYSPELYAAQVELLSSLKARTDLAASPDALMRRTAGTTVAAVKQRLKLWGLSEGQIAAMEHRRTASDHVRILSPLSGVVVHKAATAGQYVQTGSPLYQVADLSRLWLTIDAYESDLPWLRVGQKVDFTVAAVPGKAFHGRIIFIDPVLDTRSRTAEVRVEVPNPNGSLKPGLFADVKVTASLDEQSQPTTDQRAVSPLVIPATAPLITGKRALVYVREPDHDKPTFTGREVVLGPKAGDLYIVTSGLSEGDQVVTNGAFKIDSALQIQAKPSMMNPPADHAPTALSATAPPAAFQAQLQQILEAYLKIQQALFADDAQSAKQAAADFSANLNLVDMTLLTGDAHQVWLRDLGSLGKFSAALAASGDLVGQRQALLQLGPVLWTTLEHFGYRDTRTIRKFHCPMANQNKGGDWIQREPTTANPFFGSAMPRCGSQTDSLNAVPTVPQPR